MSVTNKKTFGDEGEEIAAQFLIKKGFEIVERNYRYGKGEIDIVAKDPRDNFLVFVEVKTRNNLEYGDPVYAINKNKIKQLKKIGELYLFDKDLTDTDCRFDVVSVLLGNPNDPVIEHYENAF